MGERLHLVVKFSEDMYDTNNVIMLHNKVALRRGAVWFGKAYHLMSQNALNEMNEQIANGFTTQLFLIDKKRSKPIAHFANLLCLSTRVPKEEELIPPFYREKRIRSRMKVWLKVDCFSGFYMDEFPELEKTNKFYEEITAWGDACSEYFLMYEEVS